MEILSVDIMYVMSFLVFVFCAYKYGHKRMRKVLDDKIQAIANLLLRAQQQKEDAQIILSRMQYDISELEKTMRQRDVELAERIQAFQEQQKRDLSDLVREREAHQQALLIAEKTMALNALKQEMIDHVIQALLTMMKDDPTLQKDFMDKSLSFLHQKAS